MDIEKRAFYNSLRLDWEEDPSLEIEHWQIENYRVLPIEVLFNRLHQLEIDLDRSSFLSYAENLDSPEELTENLFIEVNDPLIQDEAYLIIFELWRRLLPEKPSLSLFCDQLDHLINLYNKGFLETEEPLQDALSNLLEILNDNTDEGANPVEVFKYVASGCANNLEEFLYDFILDKIDQEDTVYAAELIEDFFEYIPDRKWFIFLKVRLQAILDPSLFIKQLKSLIMDTVAESKDIDFNLDVLAFLSDTEQQEELYTQVVKYTVPLIKIEEDLQEIFTISSDFYLYKGYDERNAKMVTILNKRANRPADAIVSPKDEDLIELLHIIK